MLDGLKALAALGLIGVAASKSAQKKRNIQAREELNSRKRKIKYRCPACGCMHITTVYSDGPQSIYCGSAKRSVCVTNYYIIE